MFFEDVILLLKYTVRELGHVFRNCCAIILQCTYNTADISKDLLVIITPKKSTAKPQEEKKQGFIQDVRILNILCSNHTIKHEKIRIPNFESISTVTGILVSSQSKLSLKCSEFELASSSSLPVTLTSKNLRIQQLNIDMSGLPPAKQSNKLRFLRPFIDLFSTSRSPSYQWAQSVTFDKPIASKTTLPISSATKECGSTAYEGLKTAIQGIYECSGIFPPLETTAGGLLTISKVVDVCGSTCSTCKCVINLSCCPSEIFSE